MNSWNKIYWINIDDWLVWTSLLILRSNNYFDKNAKTQILPSDPGRIL